MAYERSTFSHDGRTYVVRHDRDEVLSVEEIVPVRSRRRHMAVLAAWKAQQAQVAERPQFTCGGGTEND